MSWYRYSNSNISIDTSRYEESLRSYISEMIDWQASERSRLSDFKLDDAWIIGGAKLIESYWNAIHRIHLTRVHQQFDCDVFIDLVNLAIDFNLVSSEQCIDHTYEIWERK